METKELSNLKLYAKDGYIIDQETGKTIALIPYFDKTNEEQKALMKLLAAAPDLFKSCLAIDDIYSEIYNMIDGETKLAINLVREAIEKVKY